MRRAGCGDTTSLAATSGRSPPRPTSAARQPTRRPLPHEARRPQRRPEPVRGRAQSPNPLREAIAPPLESGEVSIVEGVTATAIADLCVPEDRCRGVPGDLPPGARTRPPVAGYDGTSRSALRPLARRGAGGPAAPSPPQEGPGL